MCLGQTGQQLQELLQAPTADRGQTPDSSWEEQERSHQTCAASLVALAPICTAHGQLPVKAAPLHKILPDQRMELRTKKGRQPPEEGTR